MTLAAQVGEALTEARGERARAEVARALGIVPISLLRLERGDANPTLGRLEHIAAAYGVELEITVKGGVGVGSTAS